jgi:hypothetical protein
MTYGRLVWILITSVVLSVHAVSATPATLKLLKIDPDPVAAGSTFTVVVSLTNPRTTPILVNVYASTDNPFTHEVFQFGPGQVRILELAGHFSQAGNHAVHVTAAVQNGTHVTPIGYALGSVIVYPVSAPPARPKLIDIGPDEPEEEKSKPIRSGVVGVMAGSQEELFAIPKTGGVWRSRNGTPWTHLPSSPPRAFSIAIEPGTTHLAVGEREDDNPNPAVGRSGLWESTDSGDTWYYTYDPSPLATNQRVPAVAFSNTTSTLFIATSIGVARRPKSQSAAKPFSEPVTYGFRNQADPNCGASNSTTPLGAITALVTSETRVWSRTSSQLFYSDDDGKIWNCFSFPTTVNLPGAPNMQADFNSGSGGSVAPDNQTLAAFDDQAYVIFLPSVPQSDPRSSVDPRCNSGSPKFESGFNECQINNVTTLLIYQPATKRTLVPSYSVQYTLDNDGRGNGGHRFVRAYSIDPVKCPALSSRAIGAGRQVFIGHAQSVEQALSLDSSGRLIFDDSVGTSAEGPSTFLLDASGQIVNRASPLNWDKPIHPDIWDFLLPSDFCPTTKPLVFMGNDGGVYQGTPSGAGARIAAMTWTTHSEGLHVQTAQMLTISDLPSSSQPDSEAVPSSVGYPTQDNDSWWRTIDGTWLPGTNQGDSNYIAGDIALPHAITWRILEPGDATFYNGSTAPLPVTLNRDTLGVTQPLDSSGVIQAVQTLNSDPPPSSLDMVMLAQLPVPDKNGNPVSDPSGGTGSGKRMALMRNENFSAGPDGPATSFAAWHIVNDKIPAGAGRLWLSGGHANTKFFLYTDSTNPTCPSGLQWLSDIGLRGVHPSTWVCLIQNLLDDGGVAAGPSFGIVRQQGPAFVDPFNPGIIAVAVRGSAGSPNTLKISVDGGGNFCQLPVLTALVTESGRYSLVGTYSPGVPFLAVGSLFHGFPLSVPSHIAFNRNNPSQMLVASPYTGLYFGTVSNGSTETGNCTESWKDITPFLPNSRSYISGSAFFGNGAIVSTEGRGAYAISNIPAAQTASYFESQLSTSMAGQFATLYQGNGTPIPWGSVTITGKNVAPSSLPIAAQVRTDANGQLFLSSAFVPGQYVMDLKFLGDGTITPSTVKFELTVN